MSAYAQSDDEGRLVAGPEKMNTAAPIPALTLTIHSVQHFEPTAERRQRRHRTAIGLCR
jgi:hypothetical protein